MRKVWKRLAVGAVLVLALVAAVSSLAGILAEFHDEETIEANIIVAGTLDISIENAHWLSDVSSVKPGDEFVFQFTLRSEGSLPLDYHVEHELSGDLAGGSRPCYIKGVKIDGSATTSGSLSKAGGSDTTDTIEVTIAMPSDAGGEYQGKSGHLEVTVHAVQQ